MSEPITLHKDGLSVTITAPSYARELQGQGWSTEPADDAGDLPFSFVDTEPELVPDVGVVPVKAKRGRPKKVSQ